MSGHESFTQGTNCGGRNAAWWLWFPNCCGQTEPEPPQSKPINWWHQFARNLQAQLLSRDLLLPFVLITVQKMLQVFQLQVQPIVELQARHQQGRLELEAVDCQLEGLGLVDDFQLRLHSWLQATGSGLEGEARLVVEVSQPSLLRLIPPRILEATGRSVLSGFLLGLRRRVSQQLAGDFQAWCHGRADDVREG